MKAGDAVAVDLDRADGLATRALDATHADLGGRRAGSRVPAVKPAAEQGIENLEAGLELDRPDLEACPDIARRRSGASRHEAGI